MTRARQQSRKSIWQFCARDWARGGGGERDGVVGQGRERKTSTKETKRLAHPAGGHTTRTRRDPPSEYRSEGIFEIRELFPHKQELSP